MMLKALNHGLQTPLQTPIHLPGNGTCRQLHSRVLQSPLAGVTDKIFRGLVRRWSRDSLLFTEMVNATSLELGHDNGKMDDLKAEHGPIAVQLFDHRPQAMADAARRAEQAGAFLIDINMGCPVRKIAKKGGGSGLIRDPDLATQIVEAVVEAVSIPVTVKTRLGWCGTSSDPNHLVPTTSKCRRPNVDAAWANPRTGFQRPRELERHRGGQTSLNDSSDCQW
jgi:tRNA-dihydrouridine synthase